MSATGVTVPAGGQALIGPLPFTAPVSGIYTFAVDATSIGSGPRQSYALVITGDLATAAPEFSKHRAARH